MSELWSITVWEVLERVTEKFPDMQAVKYNDRPYRRTWKEFRDECDKVARGFLAAGLGKGDHVAIWATNVEEWLITLFATARIGIVLVTVNTNYKVFELEYLLRNSDAKALVMIKGHRDSDYIEIVNSLCPMLKDSEPGKLSHPMLPHLKTVICIGEDTPAGMMNYKELYALAVEADERQFKEMCDSLQPEDVINIQYTSGTTGFPKGVMLTHNNIVNNGRDIGRCMKLTEKDRLCIPVPLFHCFGLVLATMASVTNFASMVPVEAFRPADVMKAVEEEECTALHGVPTMFIAILGHPDFKKHKFTKLRTGIMAGSPCPIKTMQQVIDEMGMTDITITYGQTEASPACTMTTTDDTVERRVATVGRAMPLVETKIIDIETGEQVPPNTPGEFCARGYNIMKGYYKMEEATAQAIDVAGWLHTGDIATVDEHGYYKITGRIKDMIIRGGENIYPKEIEDFLYHHPSISDVQVIGVPSQRYGEEIAACIIVKSGCALTEDEVKEYVRASMARHKVPSYVVFMDSFPMTASGKIQKYIMREQLVEKLNLQAAASIETA